MPAHSLVKCAQKVLIELLLSVLIQLVVFLEEGLLGADLCQDAVLVVASRCDSSAFIATTVRWGDCLDLLDNSGSWVNLVNHCEETCKFGPMTWQYFQLLNEIVSALRGQEGQFIDIRAIALFSQFECVLLEVKGAQELINGQAW